MVSIIVPVYNGEKFCDRCFDCILAQTDKDIELIVVNDGSKDRSDEVIEKRRSELERELTKFIYIKQENQGVGGAANNGFKHASGEYMMFYDMDDILMPESVAHLSGWLNEHKDYGLVRCNGYYVDEDNVAAEDRLFETNEYMKHKEDIFDDLMLNRTYVWAATYMIRMSDAEKIYPEHDIFPSRLGQNIQFLLPISHMSKVGFVDEPLAKYVLRSESTSRSKSGDIKAQKIKNLVGYEELRRRLVKLIFTGDELDYWNNQVEILYRKLYIGLAYDFKDKELMKKSFDDLKKCQKHIDAEEKISYGEIMWPAFVSKPYIFVLKGMRKMHIVK